jgi:hypothetical protein
MLEFQGHPGNNALIGVISLEKINRGPNLVSMDSGATVMFSVTGIPVITKY